MTWFIETTGFGWSEEVTVSRFWFPGGHATLVVNAGPYDVNRQAVTDSLKDASHCSAMVIIADDETALLREMQWVIFGQFDWEYNRLVDYNAESWKDGFDLPFVRTRCIRQGVEWMFDGVVFADLWEPMKKRLNTAYGASSSANSLTAVE